MKNTHVWYKAKLLPASQGIFTDSFYPEQKRTGAQYVWFTQIEPTAASAKVLVSSKLTEGALRILTLDLAKFCLEPKAKATASEMDQLNILATNLKDKI